MTNLGDKILTLPGVIIGSYALDLAGPDSDIDFVVSERTLRTQLTESEYIQLLEISKGDYGEELALPLYNSWFVSPTAQIVARGRPLNLIVYSETGHGDQCISAHRRTIQEVSAIPHDLQRNKSDRIAIYHAVWSAIFNLIQQENAK